MADRPILFSAPMVRALLAGSKTQTRRVLPEKYRGILMPAHSVSTGPSGPMAHEYDRSWPVRTGWEVGDRLWVRETWRPYYLGDGIWDLDVAYAADGERRTIKDGEFGEGDWTWPKAADRGNVTPLFMPRWASRLTLTVTDVRVERLQDISEADAIAEGVDCGPGADGPVTEYERLWNEINGPDAWDQNPWVVAVSFDVRHGNIDGGSDATR